MDDCIPLREDLIEGLDAIGAELGGITDDRTRRLIKQRKITAFKLLGKWAARRSRLRADVERLEREAAAR
jgi:hypothetical protein